ncbi:MAG: hypothetical protein IKG87_03260 [Clostridia bacterium]|nr:hypothetical protein [Clostridia bacterium]
MSTSYIPWNGCTGRKTLNRRSGFLIKKTLTHYGSADLPEGTIITAPYFSDILVPVTTQTRLNEGTARTKK